LRSAWRLGDLTSTEVLVQRAPLQMHDKSPRIKRAANALRTRLPEDSEAHLIWVPGRIEIAGKHTDYAGGRSLVAATEQGFVMVVVPRSERRILVLDAAAELSFEFDLDEDPSISHDSWQAYPVTVARRLDQNFPGLSRGAYISFVSNLPAAAGLSSSSALIVGFFLALATVNCLSDRDDYRQAIPTLEALAGYLGAMENGYPYGDLEGTRGVGTFGGSEDHTAILCARPGSIVQYSYSPVRFETTIRLPKELVLVVAASGVRAEKTGAAKADYNRLSLLSQDVARLWREATGRNLPDLGSILAADFEAATEFRSTLGPIEDAGLAADDLQKRFEHFRQESEVIVPKAAAALQTRDLDQFGRWIDQSMKLAETLLGNQVPETSFLAARARQLGAVAASAFGAGFGGAVWALVSRSDPETFKEHLKECYRAAFPQHEETATFLLTDAGPPAMEIHPQP